MVRENREFVTKQVLVKVLNTEHNTECLLVQLCIHVHQFGWVSVCKAYAIGRSKLFSNRCDKTPPTPYGEASHDSINGFMGS